jgi:2-C-methyl-D-erythritol 4-phosphate cytidylyltransferase
MNIAIILSGGVGNRMGTDIPKQYILVGHKPVISYCMDTFLCNDKIDSMVVVVAEEWKEFVKSQIEKIHTSKSVYYAPAGENRQFSVYNGLKIAREQGAKDDDIVIIHDAARPLVSPELISRCIAGCQHAEGVMPVLPVKDTTYYSKDGRHIDSLLERKCLWAGQAPEAFVFGKYLDAHETCGFDGLMKIVGSTELAYKAGMKCEMTEGDPMNFKITTPDDLQLFQSIILKTSKR